MRGGLPGRGLPRKGHQDRLRDRPPTPPETLRRAPQIACKNGVRYAYVGNVHDPEADSTFCHVCRTLLRRLCTWATSR